jgi:type I restriction enzyme M protein
MVTGQIKNQIDQLWDVFWNGGITNSITILEQMTYLFFMKMLDDRQLEKEQLEAIGVPMSNPTFPQGKWKNPDTQEEVEVQSLRWNVFKHKDSEEMFRIVSKHAFAYIKYLNTGSESAYSRFMDSAIFLIQNPRMLQKVVDGIDALDMKNRDAMGDTYEYILGKMAASGNNGQFRTPRHIIRMMVEMMEPNLQDTVCDPAMGSAGFIVETAKYVQERYRTELMHEQHLQHFRSTMLHGFDTDTTMLRIGAMNLMLHEVDNPMVGYRDSLSADNTDTNRYSLILANPPFAGSLDYEGVAKSLLAVAKTKKTELLFIALFLRSLKLGGRCASIVPDGVLTGTSKAHKAIRKEIVDGNRLQAVISMPSGVFKPYSGVSTAVLVFTKTTAGGTDKVWFYDMRADGFSLDDKRTPVSENDIPDIIVRFKNLKEEENRSRKDQSFLVPVEEIRQHDYDLAFNTYKESVREEKTFDSPQKILKRIATLEDEIQTNMVELKNLLDDEA